jgi:hypothetical protein
VNELKSKSVEFCPEIGIAPIGTDLSAQRSVSGISPPKSLGIANPIWNRNSAYTQPSRYDPARRLKASTL